MPSTKNLAAFAGVAIQNYLLRVTDRSVYLSIKARVERRIMVELNQIDLDST